MRRTLNFKADEWFGNLLYRGISIEARGLLTDMASMMNPYGALCISGTQVVFTKDQVFRYANLVDEQGDRILAELMDAGLVTIIDGVFKISTDMFQFPRKRK